MAELFRLDPDLEKREYAWKSAIAGNKLGFMANEADKALDFRNREWFKKAVKVIRISERVESYR